MSIESAEASDEPPPNRHSVRESWSILKGFIRPYRRIIAMGCAGNLITVSIMLTTPLFAKVLIDTVIPSRNLALAVGLGITYFLLQFFRHRLGYGHAFLIQYAGARVVFDIRNKLFSHLQLLHLSFFERQQSASLVNRVINDVASIQQFVNLAFNTLANSLFSLALALTIIFFLNWQLALFCLVILPFYFAVIRHYQPQIKEDSRKFRERQARVAGTIGEVFSGIKVVKSFAGEDWERQRFEQMSRDNLVPELELNAKGFRMWSILASFNDFVMAGLFVGGAWAVMGDRMTTGDYVAFTGYLTALFAPMHQLNALLQVSIMARTGFDRIVDILEVQPEVRDLPGAQPVDRVEGRIEFEDVWFSYKDRPAIEDFSLAVNPGEMIAIVGPSGSGKSTLMNLLTRFHDPQKGYLRLDGKDIRTLRYRDYRRAIGIVLQENFLFAGTLFDNIRYGKPDATLEEIRGAAEQANALEFIEELPDGFDSIVGERGTQLSGGQRQRIAIARALLRNPPILIFDEATSALDPLSEHLIQEALYKLVSNRTVFVIAHRLSTIQRADRIVVLERGRMVESGTHEQLLKDGKVYAQMFQIQDLARRSA